MDDEKFPVIKNTEQSENNFSRKYKKNSIFILIIFFAVSMGMLLGKGISDNMGDKNKKNQAETYVNLIKSVAEDNSEGGLSVKDVVKLTENSVVEIVTETVIRGVRLGQFVSEGAGSGVIISDDGYIVTNYHVIDDVEKVTVKLKDGTEYEGRIVGKNQKNDVSVIKIDAKNLQPAVLGDSDKLEVGDTAIVIGNPLGSLGGTVTNGIISALDREIDLGDSKMNLLQTNAAVNPGNSGGGLFNDKAELVGLVVAKSAGSDIEGIGFAIPINDIENIIGELRDYGYVKGRVQLGVNLINVTEGRVASFYNLDDTGLYVQSVISGSDADIAGVKAGDKITYFNGKKIEEYSNFKDELSKIKADDEVEIVVFRRGKEYKLKVRFTEYKGD